ncbi:RNA polymerase sigma factor [Paenibacillus oceani]|uniref:RNA polymerase sigma factor n=1 Tax=Paenibacillus oceani TaxID=2772510 RepID=A0A927C5U7_9BACL|nr:RNA polymerase sigma factor [Paenibacillus oceani]MBD2860557.1 RNA polymerase sigma factor [Paenibacillus oceani]
MEEKWLEDISRGRIESLELLYSELRVPVYGYILSIVSHRALAEDLTQDTFVQVYSKAGLYQKGTSPRSWVFTIARNLAYDTLRRTSRMTSVPSEQIDTRASADNPETEIVDTLYVMKILNSLRDPERQIVILKLLNGCTHSEISDILQIPEGTVKWKYRKALHHLENQFGGDR